VGAGVAASSSGIAEGTVVAGALTGAEGETAWSRIDVGMPRERLVMICSTKAMKMKMPPHHQLALVSKLPASRCPRNESDDDEVPPALFPISNYPRGFLLRKTQSNKAFSSSFVWVEIEK
jgi:hypothetical protein